MRMELSTDPVRLPPARAVKPAPVVLDVGAVRLAGERIASDDPGARGIVFTHGAGQTRGAWGLTARRFAALGWHTLAVDARGHGGSGRNPPNVAYTTDQLVADLLGWAATFASRPVLVGASMGGLTGLVAQARHECFSALVLVDVTPRWQPEGVGRILGFMRAHADGFTRIDEAADAIAAYMPHRPRKSAQALAALLERDADGRWRWHWDPRIVEDLSLALEQRQHELVEAARQIRVPTLLVTGSASDVVSDDTVAEFLALVPHAQHRQIANARHLIAGDDNDAFASAVFDFLDSSALRPAA